jgi:chaperonin GroES
MTKINPVAGYILVEPQKQESVTASGIVLPGNEKEKPQQGKVLAIGGSVYHDSREFTAPCKVDDTIMFKEWGVNEIKEDDKKYFLIKFDDVMAIIK